jgi:DNA polymerase-3 subunit epsilon
MPTELPLFPGLSQEPAAEPQPLAAASPPECRLALIVDVETTGLDVEHDQPIEVAAILYNIEHRAIAAQISYLLPVLENKVEAINGIPAALTRSARTDFISFEDAVFTLWRMADVVIAHNADFDRAWFEQMGLFGVLYDAKPWLCTLRDFRWGIPGLRPNPSLTDLALAHGVPVWEVHRALPDCTYLASVFSKRTDLAALIEDARTPQFLYEAVVGFADKEKAKAAGFQWSANGHERTWTRKLRAAEAEALPFHCRQLP